MLLVIDVGHTNTKVGLCDDAGQTIAAFARLRNEMLALLRGLAADQWSRGGVHLDGRGRRTIEEFLTVMAWHDDNHLDQLRRALAGQP